MTKTSKNKPVYDLEERTFQFANRVRKVLRKIKPDIIIDEDKKQLVKSSGWVGANYIEANESLSKKDFSYRIKICRKEAKESAYWLRLVTEQVENSILKKELQELYQEANELKRYFLQSMKNQSNYLKINILDIVIYLSFGICFLVLNVRLIK